MANKERDHYKQILDATTRKETIDDLNETEIQ